MKKRMLSLLLAVCMLVSLLPVGMLTVSADDAEPTYSYNFKATAAYAGGGAAYQIKTTGTHLTYAQAEAAGSDPLQFAKRLAYPGSQVWSTFVYTTATDANGVNGGIFYMQQPTTEEKGAILFTIKVGEPGVYSSEVIFDSMYDERNTTANFYITPTSVGTVAAAEVSDYHLIHIPDVDSKKYAFGHVATSADAENNPNQTMILAAGEYNLWYIMDAPNGGSANAYAPIDTLNLYKVGEVPVTSITISGNNNKVLQVGETANLSATVLPAGAAYQPVTWTSSNTDVATVSGGTVVAKATGITTITATCGNKSESVTMVVGALKGDYEFQDFVVANSSAVDTADKTNYGGWVYADKTSNLALSGTVAFIQGDGKYYAIRVEIPEDGIYRAEMVYDTWTSSSDAEVFICPTGTTDVWNEQYSAVKVPWATANGSDLIAVGHQDLQLFAGSYTIYLRNYGSYWKGHYVQDGVAYDYINPETGAYGAGNYDRYFLPDELHLYKTGEIATTVTISGAPASLERGETATLTASVAPASLAQTVTWNSSNNSVATVDANGVVTAKGKGTVTITATATAGDKSSASVTINITGPDRILEIQDYVVDNGQNAAVLTNATVESTANYGAWAVHSYDGTPSIYVASSAITPNVISLSRHYAVKFKIAESGLYNLKAICDVWASSCDANVYLTESSVTSSSNAFVDANKVLYIPWGANIGDRADVETVSNTSFVLDENKEYVLWIKPEASFVYADKSYINPETNQPGTGNFDRYFFIDELDLYRVGDVPVESIAISTTDEVIAVGESTTFTVTTVPDAALDRVAWSSSDDNVATVNANGVVTAVSNGVATITATADDKSASAKVYVSSPTITYNFLGDAAAIGTEGMFGDDTTYTYDTTGTNGNGKWAYSRWFDTNSKYGVYYSSTLGIYFNGARDTVDAPVYDESFFAFQIKVEEGGEYRAVVNYRTWNTQAPCEVYITPIGVTAHDEIMSEKYHVASMKSTRVEDPNWEHTSDNTILLGEGEYNVWFYKHDEAWDDRYVGLNNLQLHKVGDVVSTANGAAIRTREPHGQRFTFYLDNKYQQGDNKVVGWGSVLVPTAALVNGATVEDMKIGATLNGYAVADVPAVLQYKVTPETTTFTAVLTGIPATKPYYRRSITARAYAVLEDGTVIYSDSFVSRSIFEVAYKICKAPQPNEGDAAKKMAQAIYDIAYDAELDAELDAEYGNN